MKTWKDITDDMIDEVLDRFDFDKVKRVMDALDWKWEGKVPTVEDMRQHAASLLAQPKDQLTMMAGYTGCGSGGFEASWDRNGHLSLAFIVEWSDNEGSGQ